MQLNILIISACIASVRLATTQASVPTGSVLQPGDHVRITVISDEKDLSGEFEVAPDSTLKHPLYNQVKVAGVALPRLRETIAAFLRKFQREPQLEVEPLFKVTVNGEVKNPNIYFLPPETTLADAVGRAGGATDRGNVEHASLMRGGRVASINLRSLTPANALQTIGSGDLISIQPRRNLIGGITPFLGIAASLISISVIILSQR